MTSRHILFRILTGAIAALMLGAAAHADELLYITVDTSSLAGQANSELSFEMTDGSGTADGNNTATVSNVALNGGSLDAVDPYNVGGAGDLGSTLTLSDNTPPYTWFGQYLTPGSTLSFNLDLSGNVDANSLPDALYMYLTDPAYNYIPTQDPTGGNSLFAVTFNGLQPAVSNYDSALVSITNPGSVNAAPEIDPSGAFGALSLLAGLLAVFGGRRRAADPR